MSEIFITSVDKDGLGEGFDIDLMNILDKTINIPYIISGGYGNPNHLYEIKHLQKLSGLATSYDLPPSQDTETLISSIFGPILPKIRPVNICSCKLVRPSRHHAHL